MERTDKCVKLEGLDVNAVEALLERWGMQEFGGFVRERQTDGRKILDVTEGIVKLWQPKVNAKKFILFIENLKLNPEKYLGENETKEELKETETTDSMNVSIESQYQTVKKVKTQPRTSISNVEDLIKRIVPAKSFLYRHQQPKQEKSIPSYMPMDGGTKKTKKFFRLSSYEYPNFDILSMFSKPENVQDRGYYSVKTNTQYYIQKTYKKQDTRTKYKSLQTPEELNEKLPEDHFYEDLCYNDINKDEENKLNNYSQVNNLKPCLAKIQDLFTTFKMPFFKKSEAIEEFKKAEEIEKEKAMGKEKETNFYENGDSIANMYDSVHVKHPSDVTGRENEQSTLPVEDYLEPVVVSKDYCDVAHRQRDESLLGYIMSILDTRFGLRRETSDANQSGESDSEPENSTKVRTENGDSGGTEKCHNMAHRPLPVPVENEPYYMNVDRPEAENLLRGQPDGAFVLRPSSQPNHAYTLTVSCASAVHNVGVRRRSDGRLALGFARRGERSFGSVPSLLRHHKKKRLLLVTAGGVIGATTLNDTPQYYQTPTSNIPVA